MNDPQHQHTPVSRTGIAKASIPDGPNPFAVNRDPSGRDETARDEASRDGRLRWMRLTDLHHDPTVAERLMNGVDLQARLVRWTRGLPVRGIRTLRNLGKTKPAPHHDVDHEGPELS
ncbi:hypothetical protein [Myceligenerans crystallogenes]|uniref:Uncharacterized protein n=1 Tax=Myceligenerans crystallogenes TaxID=316335 RepID=A0ABN2NL78_9MICO